MIWAISLGKRRRACRGYPRSGWTDESPRVGPRAETPSCGAASGRGLKPARRADGTPLEMHLSTHLPADLWIVEIRRPDGAATQLFDQAVAGETLRLPDGGSAVLHVPYLPDQRSAAKTRGAARLWIATLE